MKVISYSLFNGNKEPFEKMAYIRGFYFNVRMNRLIYPDWNTFLSIDLSTYKQYQKFFDDLGVIIQVFGYTPALCEGMLWRMTPIWSEGITHILCRDTDAITTYKEAQAVHEWVDSGLGFHGITDNQAHSLPMMGGMVGFKVDHFKQLFPQWKSLSDMTKRFNLSRHGSDQQLLMADIYPKAKGDLFVHAFAGYTGDREVNRVRQTANPIPPGVSPKLWESNLTCRHIGSAGCVEMETLRFFKRFDKTDYSEFEKQHSEICYWTR